MTYQTELENITKMDTTQLRALLIHNLNQANSGNRSFKDAQTLIKLVNKEVLQRIEKIEK